MFKYVIIKIINLKSLNFMFKILYKGELWQIKKRQAKLAKKRN